MLKNSTAPIRSRKLLARSISGNTFQTTTRDDSRNLNAGGKERKEDPEKEKSQNGTQWNAEV